MLARTACGEVAGAIDADSMIGPLPVVDPKLDAFAAQSMCACAASMEPIPLPLFGDARAEEAAATTAITVDEGPCDSGWSAVVIAFGGLSESKRESSFMRPTPSPSSNRRCRPKWRSSKCSHSLMQVL